MSDDQQSIFMETPEEDSLMIKEIMYKDIKYNLYINKKNDKIKFSLLNDFDKYEKEYILKDLHKINKYFKMFDNLENLVNDLIANISEYKNDLQIINVNNQEFSINIKILAREDNIVKIVLKKKI